jgi:ATP-binding cassette, subfamily B, bacterial
MKKQVSATTKRTLQWFWYFTRPDKRLFIISSVMSAAAMVAQDIIPPFIVSRAFNELQRLYSTGKPIDFWQLDHYAWAYISFLLAGFILWRTQVLFAWLFEIRSMQRVMEHVFNHLQRQSNTFHADHFGGALVSHANKFVGAYERLMDDFTWSIIPWCVALTGSVLVLSTVAWQYAIALLIACLVYLVVMGRRAIRQQKYDRALADSESNRTAKLADNITNISTVRAFAGEKSENSLFHNQTEHTRKANMDLLRVAMRNEMASHAGTMSINILAFTGGLLIVSVFDAPLGSLFLAVNYTMALSRRLWESNRVIRNINRALGDATNMTEILDHEPEIQDSAQAESFRASTGTVSFKDVTFGYSDGNGNNVFQGLNLEIPAGQKVGLVGPSGGGKTTITKLIMRFMDIQGGQITIDGKDISRIKLADLRSSLTSVPQEPLLFHRTIAENIRYGNPEATDAEVEHVAKLAHAHEFIKELSDGYDTLVGERGVKLSGGQRQRIAIARAMLKDAPILILDEATSALDSESEVLIQDALWRLMEKRTAVVIAHRLSTIQHMDRIMVIDQGKIVEQGSHKQLLKRKGLYAKLWSHQSGGFIEE